MSISQDFILLEKEKKADHIHRLENILNAKATSFGVNLHSSQSGLYRHLLSLPAPTLDGVAQGLSNVISAFETCTEENLDPWNDTEFFHICMRQLGLMAPKDFLSHALEGDLMEGYNMSRIQIFRNLPFMEMINYSLTEILSYEWPLLYDRETQITDQIINYCDQTLWEANQTIPFLIPEHKIRETRSAERQFFGVQFKFMCPLFSGPNQPAGLVGSFRAVPVEGFGRVMPSFANSL